MLNYFEEKQQRVKDFKETSFKWIKSQFDNCPYISIETIEDLDNACKAFEDRMTDFKKNNPKLNIMPIMREEMVLLRYEVNIHFTKINKIHPLSEIKSYMTQYGLVEFKITKFYYNPYKN
jgi:hypothetical protein